MNSRAPLMKRVICPEGVDARMWEGVSPDPIPQKETSLYVVGFMFDKDMTNVALIRKRKPAWQAGLLNGIGGSIESGEIPVDAMRREFKEEAGVDVPVSDWRHFLSMSGINNDGSAFNVEFFYCFGVLWRIESKTKELIELHESRRIAFGDGGTVGNVPWAVALALDCGLGVYPPAKVTAVYSPN